MQLKNNVTCRAQLVLVTNPFSNRHVMHTLQPFKYFAYIGYKRLNIKEAVGFIPSKATCGNTYLHISMPCIYRNVIMIYSSACKGAATYWYKIKSTGYSLWRTICYISIWSAPVQRLDLSLSPCLLS